MCSGKNWGSEFGVENQHIRGEPDMLVKELVAVEIGGGTADQISCAKALSG